MSKFIKGITLFFIFIFITIFLLEKKYTTYQNAYDIVFKDLKKNTLLYTDIYIGNSHAMALGTFTNKEASKVVNLGTPGQDLFKTYTILKKWLPLMTNVKYVYVGLDYESIGQNLSLSGLGYEDRQIYKYTDTLYDNSIENILMAKSNFFRSKRDVKYIFFRRDFSLSKNFIPPNFKLNYEDCKKRALEHSQIRFKQDLIVENINLLESIIEVIKLNNKDIILFNPPKNSCYIENVNIKNINIAKEKIDNVLKKHSISFYNNDNFNESHFIDYDHLNKKGSIKLIKGINRQLIQNINK